jgi:hypothetical protein
MASHEQYHKPPNTTSRPISELKVTRANGIHLSHNSSHDCT